MRIILLLALPLAACNSSQDEQAQSNATSTDNIANEVPAALPEPWRQPTEDNEYFVATNEPFISAETKGEALLLRAVGEGDRAMRIVTRTPTPDGRRFVARDDRGEVIVTISGTACEDDMSGARYPLTGAIAIAGRRVANGCARPASAPPPGEPAPEETADAPRIPAAYVGRWDKDRAACRNPASSIEGLTISPRELRFHESLGIPTRVTRRDADTIAVTSAYEGEGLEWTATQTLRLDDGDRLIVTTRGENFERVRCG
ncbi:hypothetical protein ACX0GZ_12545 [Sphingomonas aestuarii]